jgi:glycosyltransferase involved in cell wall biosynthesis
MKVLVLHYHLNPGGVTRIIESQIMGMQRVTPGITERVLCGNDAHVTRINAAMIGVDDALNYRQSWPDKEQFEKSVQQITSLIRKHLDKKTLLHCHNPNLGKNPALTLAVYRLAQEGFATLNHAHDFAEDRPVNMALLQHCIADWGRENLAAVLYPRLPRYHFITLNSCDYRRVLHAGISASRIHLFPNPVTRDKPAAPVKTEMLRDKICRILGFDPRRKICTYPVRGIARKNLGEFILLAVLFADRAEFALTQSPKNPMELPRYDRWKAFCAEHGIRIKFESGEVVNHEELINISDFCITTSIREGFGMVYLEPWLAGTPVIGRDIPCITEDLKNHGLAFPRLYSEISLDHAGGAADFKDLAPADQEAAISRIISDPTAREQLFRDNPMLEHMLDEFPAMVISDNQRIIQELFSLENYGNKLLTLYREISE